jgi:hypothetical protein
MQLLILPTLHGYRSYHLYIYTFTQCHSKLAQIYWIFKPVVFIAKESFMWDLLKYQWQTPLLSAYRISRFNKSGTVLSITCCTKDRKEKATFKTRIFYKVYSILKIVNYKRWTPFFIHLVLTYNIHKTLTLLTIIYVQTSVMRSLYCTMC